MTGINKWAVTCYILIHMTFIWLYKCWNKRVYLFGPNCCTNIWEYCGSTSCDITHLEHRQKGKEKSDFIHHVK